MNPVRQFRERLGLSQAEFALKIDRSEAMIRNYERGASPSPDALAKMRAVAPADYAAIFATGPVPRAPEHEEWHRMLDTILSSASGDVIEALQHNLVVFHRYVQDRAKPQQVPPPGVKVGRKIVIGDVRDAGGRAKAR